MFFYCPHCFIVFLTSTLLFEISVYSVLTDWVLTLLFVWVVLSFVPLFSPIHLNSMSCFATEHFVFNSLRNRFRLDTPLATETRDVFLRLSYRTWLVVWIIWSCSIFVRVVARLISFYEVWLWLPQFSSFWLSSITQDY